MTRETAKRSIRGFPLAWQTLAQKDIEERAYITVELVPVFEMEDGYFQMTVNYKVKLEDGYIHGKAMNVNEFAKMHEAAARGEVFRIMYLKSSRIIIELEEKEA